MLKALKERVIKDDRSERGTDAVSPLRSFAENRSRAAMRKITF